MAATSTTPRTGKRDAWAYGGVTFAGVLLLVDGVLAVFQGISGIATDDVYARIGDYVFKFSLTAWGWIHLVLGVLLIITGIGLLGGAALWSRIAGVVLAGLGIIVNFLYLPYLPFWSLVLIALDLFIIWALAHYRPERSAV
ncbi:DUF7144 family membrane protein [Actinacidiphila sp. bgisy167]|uniref:DUF7144 family membrane protein n=1 Tax=Actinacidiphila sp. bgisy167 TaxID=3413797 RepID=UPI003D75CE70